MAWDTEQASSKLSGPGSVRGRVWSTLLNRSDFLRLAGGQRRSTPAFTLQAAPCDGAQPALRIGFTASRKVGNAVARNRAKRRLRALADRVMAEAGNPALDYVLVARTEAVVRDFAVMERELRQALQKISEGKAKA